MEIKPIMPPKPSFAQNTRFSKTQNTCTRLNWIPFERTHSPIRLFHMTSRDWNSLPPKVFPTTYNLQSFKTSIHRYTRRNNSATLGKIKTFKSTDTFDSYPILKSLLIFTTGSTAYYRECTFLVQLLLVTISL